MRVTFLVFLLIFFWQSSFGQSLIVGMPSADVAEKHHLELTHETQWNFWKNPQKWNSFNFICYGLGGGLELTSTLNNIDNDGSQNLAIGLGAKKVFDLAGHSDKYERKFIFGGNGLYSTTKNNTGIWTYGLLSMRMPSAKTRFTGGFSYGNSQTFGFTTKYENGRMMSSPNNKFVFMGGIEQPISKDISLICDWYSGTHDLAAFIPAAQFDFGHNVLILAYKIPNNIESGNQALIIEFMISLPTKKQNGH
jgi:hypothetical protein